MLYTVGEMARMLDVPASTLRYYDKEGLLPFVMRSSGGIRMFQESDVEWLRVIACLKSAGMSIKDIRTYIELAMQGDGTIDARLALFQKQREALLAQWPSCSRPLPRWIINAGITKPPKLPAALKPPSRCRWRRFRPGSTACASICRMFPNSCRTRCPKQFEEPFESQINSGRCLPPVFLYSFVS